MMMTSGILAFTFLAPWLMAAGAAATSIPIIIHLLNKRKFRVIVWAAMDFLLAAQRRNARRLRFQRWLLLALRCLALLVIAAGIAQLIFNSQVLGKLIGEQRAVVIIWDDSYSMGYQRPGAAPAAANAFERSRRLIADYVSHLEAADKVLVLRASRIAPQDAMKPTLDHAAVQQQVNTAAVTDAGTNLPAAFEHASQVLKELEGATRSRQVLLFTDFTNSALHDPPAGPGLAARAQGLDAHLKRAAEELREHCSPGGFRVVNVGEPHQMNMAVVDVRSKRPAVVAGAAADFEVTVLNVTDHAGLDIPLTMVLDGVPLQTEKIAKIDPGALLTATVRVTIPSAGRHLLEARLPPDLLVVDDTRRLLVNARREIPILLVDGSPGDNVTTFGSTAYLWAALAYPADNKPASPFAPKVATELDLPTIPLSAYDAVVLSDTSEPSPSVRENLRKFVESGGLLVLFPGNRTNAQRMNDTLGESGVKLLPATFGQPVKLEGADQVAAGTAFAPENYAHPVLSVFSPDIKAGKDVGFTSVQTTEYLKLGIPADGSSEVILRYAKSDGPGDAAVVMKKDVGKGNVIVFASTADMTWNSWGAKPSFLPFIHELMYYGMSRGFATEGAGLTLRVGDRFHLPAEIATAGTWNGPRDTRVSVSSEVDKQGRAMLASGPLGLAGAYMPSAGDGRPVVAVNTDAEEADVRSVGGRQMAAALGIDMSQIVEQPGTISEAAAKSEDASHSLLGPGLIATALLLFVLEAFLAMLFSTYR